MKVYICSSIWDTDMELIERYPRLNEFGFVVEEVKKTCRRPILDENREHIMQEFDKIVKEPYIFLDTLDDLTKLRDAVEERLIFGTAIDGGYMIEIYDGYRE